MTTTRASAGSMRQQVSSAGLDHFTVGRQRERDPRSLQAAGRERIDPKRLLVHSRNEAFGRQVGEADSDDVAMAFVRNVEHDEPSHDRTVEIGLSLDEEPADDVGVHARARVVFPQLADDQKVDLVEREPAHQTAGALEQDRLDFKDCLGLERGDFGGHVLGVFDDRQARGRMECS